jgi:16S rRNA (guanine527-N7)-methyltransferase
MFEPPAELAAAARDLFGDRLPIAVAYARLLATDGVVRGLIGPREVDRIWERHLLNCVVIAGLIPSGASVTDVGSGAGLPGIVLAVARPDLAVVLVEPLARRTAFLSEVVSDLGLCRVSLVRARAEEAVKDVRPADVVTARAVAPLDRLTAWCLPLARIGGRMLAVKGASAADEVVRHREVVGRLGGGTPLIRSCGAGLLATPTTVVEVTRVRQGSARPTPQTGHASSDRTSRSRTQPPKR